MAVRISGLISGLDTDSIVQELVSAYSTKKNKYTKAQTKLSWSMNQWSTVNSKAYGFYAGSLSAMRYSSGYNVKKATVSNSNIATVSAGTSAVNGTQSLSVSQLATSGYLTGGKITDANGDSFKATKSTKLSELGITDGGTIRVNDKEITLSGNTSLSELATKMKEAGVEASFDEGNQRFFVSSKTSGEAGEFSITAGNDGGLDIIKSIGLMSVKDKDGNESADIAKYRKIIAADQSSVIESRYKAAKYTETSYKKYLEDIVSSAEKGKESAQKQLDELNKEDYDWSKKYDSEEAYNDAKKALSDKIDNYNSVIDSNKAILEDSDKFKNALSEANDNIKANITSGASAELEVARKVIAGVDAGTIKNTAGSARITAQDSIISLNGAEFRGNSNSFSINGLTIDVNALTIDKEGNDNPITLTVSTDTQGVYDKIKGMLKEYNELITYFDKLYNAESAAGYEPLTDDEKDAMTDKQIEDWEAKIKDSLLRRDSTLGGLSSALKNAVASSSYVGKDGRVYKMSDFGVGTQSYFSADKNERGVLHIDGDPDDKLVSSNSDKLMAAIAADPDAVVGFFQNLSQNIYDTLSKKMASSSVSSAFTIYNDKEMSTQYSDYKDKISKWDDKLTTIEDFYHKKFSKMEAALSKLQSQTTQLAGLLGGNG